MFSRDRISKNCRTINNKKRTITLALKNQLIALFVRFFFLLSLYNLTVFITIYNIIYINLKPKSAQIKHRLKVDHHHLDQSSLRHKEFVFG